MLHVLLLRDAECGTCDQVSEELLALQQEFPQMRVRERLLDQEPVLATRLGVIASPALVVNDQLAFQGLPEPDALRTYFRNVLDGLHDDPEVYPPDDERAPENRGQEATGSSEGGGLAPAGGSRSGGRHSS